MPVARLAASVMLATLVSGCTIGTVTTPSHFGGTGNYDFLSAGQQPIPTTGGTVAVPFPDRVTGPAAERSRVRPGPL